MLLATCLPSPVTRDGPGEDEPHDGERDYQRLEVAPFPFPGSAHEASPWLAPSCPRAGVDRFAFRISKVNQANGDRDPGQHRRKGFVVACPSIAGALPWGLVPSASDQPA